MLEKVTDEIHKLLIHLTKGMDDVNCYLIEGENGYTIIDTGLYSKETVDAWKEVVDSGITIEQVVLTHTHQDHIGMAKWFQKERGIPVYVSELGYKEMQEHRNTYIREELSRLLTNHGGPDIADKMPDDRSIYDFEPDGFFQQGDMIRLGGNFYETIWTPGHAPDHMCFYNREHNVMIVGDHVLKKISPVIGLWTGKEEDVLRAYYDSLELIKQYPVDIALPGHGGVISHFTDRVNNIKVRHDHRLQEVLDSVSDASKSGNQICREIYGGDAPVGLFISQFMATLTRLIYLEEAGDVTRDELDGVFVFQAV